MELERAAMLFRLVEPCIARLNAIADETTPASISALRCYSTAHGPSLAIMADRYSAVPLSGSYSPSGRPSRLEIRGCYLVTGQYDDARSDPKLDDRSGPPLPNPPMKARAGAVALMIPARWIRREPVHRLAILKDQRPLRVRS